MFSLIFDFLCIFDLRSKLMENYNPMTNSNFCLKSFKKEILVHLQTWLYSWLIFYSDAFQMVMQPF